MYFKISHLKEVDSLKIPKELKIIIKDIAESLDDNYGSERTEEEDGGFVLFADNKDDLDLINDLELDTENNIIEYVETIETSEGTYINALYLLNNEFGITVIIPKEIASEYILDAI